MRTMLGSANHVGLWGALCTCVGGTMSGPVSLMIVELTHPQPDWESAARFAESYHPIQTLPFFCGFVLVGGLALLIAALHAQASSQARGRTTSAVIFASAFVALIAFNYVLQTTFVPALVRPYTPAHDVAVAMFSMRNPRSLAWGLEMWGYGLIGVATWLVAPQLSGSRLERTTAWLFAANGPISIAGAVWTALAPGWVLTGVGLVAFGAWNVLVIMLGALSTFVFRARIRASR